MSNKPRKIIGDKMEKIDREAVYITENGEWIWFWNDVVLKLYTNWLWYVPEI